MQNRNDAQRPLRFLYNPFEVAVCDPLGLFGDELADALARELSHECRVGLVTEASSQRAATDPVTRLINAPGHSFTAVPRGHYGAPLIQPLIELDIVIFRDDAEGPGPLVVVAGDGPPPVSEGVIAYVSEKPACPILPPGASFFTRDDLAGLAHCVTAALRAAGRAVPVFGLVLAGGTAHGESADAGPARSQLQSSFELLSGCCERTFVSARRDQRERAGFGDFSMLADAYSGFGPMGGILSAMKVYPSAAWCVLACDLPSVDRPSIETLLAGRNPLSVATAFESINGLPEPLCAVYEPKSVYPLHRAMAQGMYSLHRVLEDSSAHLLTPPNPEALTNVNTRTKEQPVGMARSKGGEGIHR